MNVRSFADYATARSWGLLPGEVKSTIRGARATVVPKNESSVLRVSKFMGFSIKGFSMGVRYAQSTTRSWAHRSRTDHSLLENTFHEPFGLEISPFSSYILL